MKDSKESQNLYKKRVDSAKKFFKDKREQEIKTWNALYVGKVFDESISAQDQTFVNYTYSNVENKISSLYYKNPKINIQPRKPNEINPQTGEILVDYAKNARNAQETLNYEMREYALKKQIRKSLYDWQISGYGSMFTGWETEMEVEEPNEGEQQPNVKSVKEDKPDFRRIRPDKIYFSPESEDDDDIHNRYVVIEECVAYEELKEDRRFKKELIDQITPSYVEGSEQKSDDEKRVKLYHIWDKDNWTIVCDGLKENLMQQPNPYKDIFGEAEALPFVFIWGVRRLGEFYPYSSVYMTQDQQNELNKERAQMIAHRKRFGRIYIYKKGKIDPLDIEKIENAEDGSMVGIETEEPLESIIVPLQDANLTYPFEVENRIVNDINVISGINEFQRGSAKDIPGTLGQTQIAEAHSQSRRDQEQSLVEDYVEKIYQRLLQLNQAFLQNPVYANIVGPNGSTEWLEINNADIQGEFDLQVESGSTVKLDDDVVRKQTLDAFNLLYQMPESHAVKKDLLVSVLETIPTMKTIAEKIKSMPQEQMYPPMPPEKPRQSMSMSVDGVIPILAQLGDIQGIQELLGQFGVKLQPMQQMPEMQGPIDPQMLQQGAPEEENILSGVNNVNG